MSLPRLWPPLPRYLQAKSTRPRLAARPIAARTLAASRTPAFRLQHAHSQLRHMHARGPRACIPAADTPAASAYAPARTKPTRMPLHLLPLHNVPTHPSTCPTHVHSNTRAFPHARPQVHSTPICPQRPHTHIHQPPRRELQSSAVRATAARPPYVLIPPSIAPTTCTLVCQNNGFIQTSKTLTLIFGLTHRGSNDVASDLGVGSKV
ncbi:hypothetical protein FIBSPDRAFT_1046110 [Athelia psychrophila]|uniref:Uncharacterized protein n=1 Tax=Athelia psychrophila TaxID=1759441 RepID=A0A166H958_9AGAM|nr:hypothetical protein FIBSPDRAFT_1046110 [Fibularhizoctonia sp. CBS 109695]